MDHSSEEFKRIAENGAILRCQVGSGVHGVAIEGTDDRDEMGICIEPPEYVIGLKQFEQYIFRTQPEGVRSGAGDLDLIIYSLRKWMRLALQGNPSVILPLFVPEHEVMRGSWAGAHLRENRDRLVSKQTTERFLGYMRAQRGQLLGIGSGTHTNRPELIEKYGFDTKFAMHMLRLGVQGVELATEGEFTTPVAEPWRTRLIELRRGEYTKDQALKWADDLESKLVDQIARSNALLDYPDEKWANEFLRQAYLDAWEQ